MYVNFAGHERWGRALYENFNGHRSFLLRETKALVDANCARMQASQEAEQRLRREGIGAIFKDYCSANPVACAGWAAVILQSGGGSGGSSKGGSNEFMTCMNNCRLRAPSEQAFCQATCYQFIAR